MTVRFTLGVIIIAIANAVASAIFFFKHELIASQPTWRYVLEFAPWQFWAFGFGATCVMKVMSLLFRSDLTARLCSIPSIAMFVMWASSSLLIFPTDTANRTTGIVPMFSLVVASLELLFIAIPSSQMLDEVRNKFVGPADGDHVKKS